MSSVLGDPLKTSVTISSVVFRLVFCRFLEAKWELHLQACFLASSILDHEHIYIAWTLLNSLNLLQLVVWRFLFHKDGRFRLVFLSKTNICGFFIFFYNLWWHCNTDSLVFTGTLISTQVCFHASRFYASRLGTNCWPAAVLWGHVRLFSRDATASEEGSRGGE